MGHYDAVLISEFPSDEACAKFMLSSGALGNISTETLKAFPKQNIARFVVRFEVNTAVGCWHIWHRRVASEPESLSLWLGLVPVSRSTTAREQMLPLRSRASWNYLSLLRWHLDPHTTTGSKQSSVICLDFCSHQTKVEIEDLCLPNSG
jgi:GYD domain